MPRQYSRISSDDFKDNGSQQIAYLRSPSTASVVSTTSVASTDPSVQSIGQRISDKIHASKSGMPHTQIIQIYNHSHLKFVASLGFLDTIHIGRGVFGIAVFDAFRSLDLEFWAGCTINDI
eukprot:scaffold1795_cov236-Chaetoceros_neogracile.AAC.4